MAGSSTFCITAADYLSSSLSNTRPKAAAAASVSAAAASPAAVSFARPSSQPGGKLTSASRDHRWHVGAPKGGSTRAHRPPRQTSLSWALPDHADVAADLAADVAEAEHGSRRESVVLNEGGRESEERDVVRGEGMEAESFVERGGEEGGSEGQRRRDEDSGGSGGGDEEEREGEGEGEGEEVLEPRTTAERRKLRQLRRRQRLEPEQRQKRREDLEEVMMQAAFKPRGKAAKEGDDASLDFLEAKGSKWWTLMVSPNAEVSVQEEVDEKLKQTFPDLEFETFVPLRRTFKVSRKGEPVFGAERFSPGCIYLRCAINQQIFDTVFGIYRVRGFVTRVTGVNRNMRTLPVEVSPKEIEIYRQQVRESEEAVAVEEKRFEETRKMQQKSSAAGAAGAAGRKAPRGAAAAAAKKMKLGCKVKVTKGTFKEFVGDVESFNDGKVKVIVNILGRRTPIEVPPSHLELVKQ